MGASDGRQAGPANDVGRPDWCAVGVAVDSWRSAWTRWWASAETRREFFEASDDEAQKAFRAGWREACYAHAHAAAARERQRCSEAPHGAPARHET